MRKLLLVLCAAVLFVSGCAIQTWENVDDPNDVQVMASPATLLIDLPEEAAAPVMKGTSGSLYFCGDFEIMVEQMPSGNLNNTLQTLTGFEREDLDLIQTNRCGAECYEGAWSAVGEAGDHVGRVLILDDGSYHYCVSIMAMAENAGLCAEEWNHIMQSIALAEG